MTSTTNLNIATKNSENTSQEEHFQTEINREEILRKRKDRRAEKREDKKLNREKLKLEQKLNKKSEKIQVVNTEHFHQQQKASTESSSSNVSRQIKLRGNLRHIQKDFNLFDFIVEKKKEKKPLRRLNVDKPLTTTIKLNRGKKREVPKQKYSRLRKIILRNRSLKNEINKTETEENLKSRKEDIGEKDTQEKLVEELKQLEISNEEKANNDSLLVASEKKIHSRRFQLYCDNTTSKELCNLTENLLRELFRFQKRAYDKNQIKARAHKRYVVGFKEVKRQLDIRKTKLIIFAPDCESCELPGGIIDIINEMKLKCKNADIPYLFACNRRHLGYILFKKVPVSCIGILSYDGVQEIFHTLIQCLEQERKNYENLMKNID